VAKVSLNDVLVGNGAAQSGMILLARRVADAKLPIACRTDVAESENVLATAGGRRALVKCRSLANCQYGVRGE